MSGTNAQTGIGWTVTGPTPAGRRHSPGYCWWVSSQKSHTTRIDESYNAIVTILYSTTVLIDNFEPYSTVWDSSPQLVWCCTAPHCHFET